MSIDYDHERNRHTVAGAAAALSVIFDEAKPNSLLDVGCGAGTWLKAARQIGVKDFVGIDGVDLAQEQLLIPRDSFLCVDLMSDWSLPRRFDAVLCLEVAEHLPADRAIPLTKSICKHSDTIIFSAACPGQPGQHHVNCQWPEYWQSLFNAEGFACTDRLRWKLWSNLKIEPWYRQNLFTASRDREQAGTEPRIPSVVHPEMLQIRESLIREQTVKQRMHAIEQGSERPTWYLSMLFKSLSAKLKRHAS